ncbi:hypothetical protein ALC62_15896 [Cyphomyrmex costatus]|uniref:Uncharacterized protein n=1 Tax=Cyphomyrmex costatus TaxID=456900 RepID=A0A195C059_9HYME|nr:hypothetical protein ALC62_15896 [Cyphomyrmex costatus]
MAEYNIDIGKLPEDVREKLAELDLELSEEHGRKGKKRAMRKREEERQWWRSSTAMKKENNADHPRLEDLDVAL